MSYVYYCSNGSGLIKIGHAINPYSRCREFRTLLPHSKLLAIEQGSRLVEQQRHRDFKEDRVAGEWFKASLKLCRHIDDLNQLQKRGVLDMDGAIPLDIIRRLAAERG